MKKKIITISIVVSVLAIIAVLLILIYNALFKGGTSSRNSDINNYELTSTEISTVESKIKELEDVESVDIHTNNNSKLIKIIVTLKKDVAFDKMKNVAINCLSGFSEENKSYYDFEFFIDTNAESEIYPKIGYKFVKNADFSW